MPYFLPPEAVSADQADQLMDEGRYTFILDIPEGLQRDLLNGERPQIQFIVDATRMSQAFTGNGYIQSIINREVSTFTQSTRSTAHRYCRASPIQPRAG